MKSSKLSWKVSRFLKLQETQKINFDLVIQRKRNIWDNHRQSMLIHSLLLNFPISSLFASKEDSVYNFLDGKQRLSSIFEYINDGFKLNPDTPLVNGEDISGLKFSELPQDMQTAILEYEIEFVKIEEISQEEIELLFFRLNNGIPLRQIETTRAILGSKVLKYIESLSKMDFFSQKVNVSAGARKRYVDQELILQILALIYNAETGFSGKELQRFVKELKTKEIQETLRAKIQNACYYLNEAFPVKEKFLKKINVPMVFIIVLNLIEKGELSKITASEFGKWAALFFENTPEEYKEASRSGSARKENVQKRLAIMTSHFNEYLANHVKAKEEERTRLAEQAELLNSIKSEEEEKDKEKEEVEQVS